MGDERLVQRVLGQQVAELADQLGVPAKLQLTRDPLQNGRAALLFEAVPHPGDPVALDPRQRLATPEPVRLAEQRGCVIVVAACGQRVRLPPQPAELVHVDRLGIDVEHVALRARRQLHVVADGLPE